MPVVRVVSVLLAATIVVTACGSDGDAASFAPSVSGSVEISGSSTVEPVSVRVAELLAERNDAIEVNVDGPGTGDGFKLFCAGETDISDASRAIKAEEADECAAAGVEFIELKVANDGITVLTSRDNDVECLAREDLYALVGPESEGVDRWSDARTLAKELGSPGKLPKASLEITAPGEESGTYDAFVELALKDIAETRGQDPVVRKDYTSQANDDAIIQGIEGSEGAFGWVGFAFAAYAEGLVKTIAIKGDNGRCIAPTRDTIADGSYPLSRPLFIYVNKAKAEANPALDAYVDFYLGEGYLAVEEVGYVALDAAELTAATQRWTSRTTGAQPA